MMMMAVVLELKVAAAIRAAKLQQFLPVECTHCTSIVHCPTTTTTTATNVTRALSKNSRIKE